VPQVRCLTTHWGSGPGDGLRVARPKAIARGLGHLLGLRLSLFPKKSRNTDAERS